MLQTVLFLTDSVFRVLFAYIDESMGSIGGYVLGIVAEIKIFYASTRSIYGVTSNEREASASSYP